MKEVREIKVVTYDCGNGFYVEIWVKPMEFDAWLSHAKYGVKSYMFGSPVDNTSFEEFKDMVEANIDEYIEYYENEYMDNEWGCIHGY